MIASICMVLCCVGVLFLSGCQKPTPDKYNYWLGTYVPYLWSDPTGEFALFVEGSSDNSYQSLRFGLDETGYVCMSTTSETDVLMRDFCKKLALDETTYNNWIADEIAELHSGFTLTRRYFKTKTQTQRIKPHGSFVNTYVLFDKENEEKNIEIAGISQYRLDPDAFAQLENPAIIFYTHKQTIYYTDGTACKLALYAVFTRQK